MGFYLLLTIFVYFYPCLPLEEDPACLWLWFAAARAATGFAPAAFGTLKPLFWGALGMEEQPEVKNSNPKYLITPILAIH